MSSGPQPTDSFAPLPASDADEAAQIEAAIAASLADVSLADDFLLVETPCSSTAGPSTAAARAEASRQGPQRLVRDSRSANEGQPPLPAPCAKAAAASLAARPPRRQPVRWYTVWSVPPAAAANLGLHHGRWAQLSVPGGRLAGSGWRCRAADSEAEARAIWFEHRDEEPPVHQYP